MGRGCPKQCHNVWQHTNVKSLDTLRRCEKNPTLSSCIINHHKASSRRRMPYTVNPLWESGCIGQPLGTSLPNENIPKECKMRLFLGKIALILPELTASKWRSCDHNKRISTAVQKSLQFPGTLFFNKEKTLQLPRCVSIARSPRFGELQEKIALFLNSPECAAE